MGTLLTLLTLGAGLGGLGWWISRRDDRPRDDGAPAPLALPPPEVDPTPAPYPDPSGTRYAPPVAPAALAPSTFVQEMRAWLEQSPPATQIELVAVQLERAGHAQTATQLRGLASDRRNTERLEVIADPPEPTSPSRAPAGSSESSPASVSDSSPSTGDGSVAPSERSAPSGGGRARALEELARRVAAMLHARQGQGTDRRLVRQFQVAARLFPERGENPSGLYGPVTRSALARHGVRNPPRPRFRAAVEAAAPRARPAPAPAPARPNAPRPGTPRPGTPRRPNAPRRSARPSAQPTTTNRPGSTRGSREDERR